MQNVGIFHSRNETPDTEGVKLLAHIEADKPLTSQIYYGLAAYNSTFKNKNLSECIQHQNRLINLFNNRVKASKVSESIIINDLLVDLQNKCPKLPNILIMGTRSTTISTVPIKKF